jgi:hypothetical protein
MRRLLLEAVDLQVLRLVELKSVAVSSGANLEIQEVAARLAGLGLLYEVDGIWRVTGIGVVALHQTEHLLTPQPAEIALED